MPLPTSGRLLGLDWGEVRIGLALSDETQTLATPLETLVRRRGKRFPMARFLERQIGRAAQVLVERDGRGRSETFAPFRIETDGAAPIPGEIVTARAERVDDGVLIGGRLTT